MRKRPYLAAALLAAGLAGGAPAQEDYSRLVVTYPADDYQPAVSPDGEWLVYVSDRGGAPGLYRRRLSARNAEPDRQIFPHPARTEQPVFSPNGEYLAFVSTRADALGDVYLVKFPNGEPERLSQRGMVDRQPRFSEDGSRLYFYSRSVNGEDTVSVYSVSGTNLDGETEVARGETALNPETPYPSKWVDLASGTALLYTFDTNADGLLDDADEPSGWERVGGEWRIATFPLKDGEGISRTGDGSDIYVAATWGDTRDVAMISATQLRDETNTATLLKLAEEQLGRRRPAYRRALSYQLAAIRRAQDEIARGDAVVQTLRTLMISGRYAATVKRADEFSALQLPAERQSQIQAIRLLADLYADTLVSTEGRTELSAEGAEREEALRKLMIEFESREEWVAASEIHLGLARLESWRGDYPKALAEADIVIERFGDRVPTELRCRAILEKANTFQKMGLVGETEQSLFRIFELSPSNIDILDRAAESLISARLQQSEEGEQSVLALRDLSSTSEHYPYLTVRARIAEAQELIALNDYVEGKAAYRQATAYLDVAPVPAAEAIAELAEVLSQQQNFDEAVEVLKQGEEQLGSTLSLEDLSPAVRDTYQRVRRGLIRYYLAKGRREMSLNDPMLALATYTQLLNYDSSLAAGWRGKISAQSTDPELLDQAIDEYREEADENPDSAVNWYKVGLSLSYPDPTSKRAIKALRRSISLDPSIPQPYVTLGFIQEQIYTKAREKGADKSETLEEALASYEQALGLVDREIDRQLYADIQLNIANAAMALGQTVRAATYYQLRARQDVAFDDPRTAFLFHFNHGIAAYRASYPGRAAEQFVLASQSLDDVVGRELISEEQGEELQLEIVGRRALALLDQGEYAEAEQLFQRLYEGSPEGSMARVRAMRNRSYLFFLMSKQEQGEARRRLAEQSMQTAQTAFSALETVQPEENAKSPGGGLFNLTIAIPTDNITGGAKTKFDIEDEERLLRGLMSLIAEHNGDHLAAIEQLQQQVALQPPLNVQNRAYYTATRTVNMSRLARESVALGRYQDAIDFALDGLSNSHFMNVELEVINPNAATLHLALLNEVALRMADPPVLDNPEAFWMLGEEVYTSPWHKLDAAAATLLDMSDPAIPDGSVPLVNDEGQRARLLLVRATVNERLFHEELQQVDEEGGVALIRAAGGAMRYAQEATGAANRLISMARATLQPGDIYRLATLAHGTLIRIQQTSDSEGTAEVLNTARQFARNAGYGGLIWWLEAQAALSASTPEKRFDLASRSLETLLNSRLYTVGPEDDLPGPVFDWLEAEMLAQAERAEAPDEAWTTADKWRVARLRWLAERAAPIARTAEEQAWLARYQEARGEYVDTQRRLRTLPFSSNLLRAQLLERADAQATILADLYAEGRDQRLRPALYFRPEPDNYGTIDSLLMAGFEALGNMALVLNRELPGRTTRAIYTADGLSFTDDLSSIQGADTVVLLGDASPDVPASAVSILTTASFYDQMLDPAFRSGNDPVPYPGDSSLADVAFAERVTITSPVMASGAAPSSWFVRESNTSLRQFVSATQGLEEVELALNFAGGEPESLRELQTLALANWLDASGLIQARIDNESWLGLSIDPVLMRDIAEQRIGELIGGFSAALDQGEYQRSVVLLEEVIRLKNALGDETELETAYAQLAELLAALEKYEGATDASKKWVELLQQDQVSDNLLADAYERMGRFAAAARDWQRTDEAYGNAIDIVAGLGETQRLYDLQTAYAFALENSGRYQKALELTRAARETAGGLSNQELAQQDVREARLMRLYFSRFTEAETLLNNAIALAQKDRNLELVADCRLNLSRVYQRLANFDRAIEMIESAERIATTQNLDTILAQAALERANVHWLRSEYFESFSAQQKALRMAQDRNSRAEEIAIYNVSGLTSWALNDYKRALEDLQYAMKLAEENVEQTGLRAEVASTANNIGLVYRSREEYDTALSWFNRALESDRIDENRWGEAYSLRNIGLTMTARGTPEEAIDPLNEAIRLTQEIGDELNEAKAQLALGEALAALDQTVEAQPAFDKALSLARAIPVREVEWRALFGLGGLAESAGDDDKALGLYDESIAVVDAMRASIRVEEFQDGFLFDKQKLYDTKIALQVRRGDDPGALETSEKSRGRNFIDLLGNRRIDLRDSQDQALLDREDALRTQIEELERRAASAPQSELPGITEELTRMRNEYSDFLIELRAASPQLSNFVRVQPVDVAELQRMIDPGTRLLIYHVLEDETLCWVLGADALDLYTLPISEEDLSTLIGETRVGLQNFEEIDQDLSRLADVLIRPLLPSLEGVERVGIVPHRALHTLPFSPLRFSEGEHLVDRYAIFYTPSASVLRYTIDRRTGTENRNKVLAIGNPDRGTDLYDLPFAEKEAKRLRYDFDDVTVRVGGEATESWIVDNLANYGIIHIASHGEYRAETPLFSALLLSPDSQNDGTLTAEEVFSLQLRADLVALSACQSGLGRVSNGDDIVGLNRAFVYAGTRQLMTTLWRVDDISTAILFKYFYRNVDEMDRAEALRQAQIRLKNRPEYVHPAHWSALILSGDWQ